MLSSAECFCWWDGHFFDYNIMGYVGVDEKSQSDGERTN